MEMDYFKGLSRKDYIIKANELIKRDGIYSVSIRKLAAEMGCSSANLYRYFSNLDELIYYAQLAELKGYIISLNAAEKIWENVWERYVGVWYCYCMEAFRKPVAYNLLFFNNYEITLSAAMGEYYNMFPEEINESSTSFQAMLKMPEFHERDFEMCKLCVKENAITYENAIILNRVVCMMYKGYLKTILDKEITDEEIINKYVWDYVNDCELAVRALALDMKGYKNYKAVIDRNYN